jgi:hypothetical protein
VQVVLILVTLDELLKVGCLTRGVLAKSGHHRRPGKGREEDDRRNDCGLSIGMLLDRNERRFFWYSSRDTVIVWIIDFPGR